MKVRLVLTLHFDREREAPSSPERPAIYDMSGAQVERAPQSDHDTRPPVSFSRNGGCDD